MKEYEPYPRLKSIILNISTFFSQRHVLSYSQSNFVSIKLNQIQLNKFLREAYGGYFDNHGLRNIFMPIIEISDIQTKKWIDKAINEINRFSNFIVLIDKYEKEPIDNYTLTSIHESLAASSVSITFSIFNIFALITGTEASFFDDHIKTFYKGYPKLNHEKMNLLSFKWHTSIQNINSLSYSIDEKLCAYKGDNIIGFNILKVNVKESPYRTKKSKVTGMIIHSKRFFSIHLLHLLSSIELISNLLSEGRYNSKAPITKGKISYLEIENLSELMSIYRDSVFKKQGKSFNLNIII